MRNEPRGNGVASDFFLLTRCITAQIARGFLCLDMGGGSIDTLRSPFWRLKRWCSRGILCTRDSGRPVLLKRAVVFFSPVSSSFNILAEMSIMVKGIVLCMPPHGSTARLHQSMTKSYLLLKFCLFVFVPALIPRAVLPAVLVTENGEFTDLTKADGRWMDG